MSRVPFIQAFTLATALSASALAEVPSAVVQEALASNRDADHASDTELNVLMALAHDEREAVRMTAAESLQSTTVEGFSEFEPLLQELAGDGAPAIRATAAATLARNVAAMPSMDRAIVLGGWATAMKAPLREAAALALGNQVCVPSADVMLEHLLDDTQTPVRLKAVQAVKLRYGHDGEAVAVLLEEAIDDVDPNVRRSARRAVSQALAV